MREPNWIHAKCSTIGSAHVSEGLPCQDNSRAELLSETDFLIAAVSDGAGSCSHSQIGSKLLVDGAIDKLATAIKLKDWFPYGSENLNGESWRDETYSLFKELKEDLRSRAIELSVDLKALSATLIVAVSNGSFVACAHVGDGRAAFRDDEGNWHPLMTPTKGEEANQTLFVTSELWDESQDSPFFETTFYGKSITAFSLLTDGCERASFEMSKYIKAEDKYADPNLPFKPFFEPNYLNLLKLKQADADQETIDRLWTNFIQKGNEKLMNETDDKTMILSVFIPTEKDEPEVQAV